MYDIEPKNERDLESGLHGQLLHLRYIRNGFNVQQRPHTATADVAEGGHSRDLVHLTHLLCEGHARNQVAHKYIIPVGLPLSSRTTCIPVIESLIVIDFRLGIMVVLIFQ